MNLKTSLLKNKDKNILKASLINITREDALKFLEIKERPIAHGAKRGANLAIEMNQFKYILKIVFCLY